MDVDTAVELNHKTLNEVRRRNDKAVLHIWQDDYQRLLVPHLSRRDNLRIEKMVERIAMIPQDYPNPAEGVVELDRLLNVAKQWGITCTKPDTHCKNALVTD